MKEKRAKRFPWALLILVVFLMICVVSCHCCGKDAPSEPCETTGTGPVTVTTGTIESMTVTVESTAPCSTEPAGTVPETTEPTSTQSTKPEEPPTTEPGHTHKHTATVTKPTCTEKGYTEHTCSCGDSYKDTYVNATGHSWGEWKTTKEPTTTATGQKTRTCSKCSSTETQNIDKLSADEPVQPTVCQHSWKSNYYPEVGHYTDYYAVCACGKKFANTSEWIAHSNSFSGEEQVLYHGSNSSGRDYIVETPGRWEWTCTKCGAVSSTKPY